MRLRGGTRTPRYAKAIDRFVALVLNHASQGKTWRRHGISKAQILEVNSRIAQGSPALWERVREMIEDAAARGLIEG